MGEHHANSRRRRRHEKEQQNGALPPLRADAGDSIISQPRGHEQDDQIRRGQRVQIEDKAGENECHGITPPERQPHRGNRERKDGERVGESCGIKCIAGKSVMMPGDQHDRREESCAS